MNTRLNLPFLRCELVSKFMIFLVFIGNLWACFIIYSCSAQDEYPDNTNNDASCKENSVNVNRFDFYESEFRLPLTTEKLREEITKDNLKAPDNTKTAINWLNDLLETPGFYERLPEKYAHQVSGNIKLIELLKKTDKYRSKEFSKLSKERQYNIKQLNRLLLEEIYPELTPNINRHVIVINKDGRLCKPDSHGKKLILQGGEKSHSAMQECNDAECNYFDKIRENIEKWDKTIKNDGKQILIFIHGGLNSFENSYERARKLLFCCTNKIPENIYPIIVNWESGIPTAYTDYVFLIRQGDTFSKGQKVLWTFASPFIFLGDFVKGIVRMPYLLGYQILNYTKTLPNRYELATEKMNEVLNKNAREGEIKISKVEYEHSIDGKKVLEDLPVIPLVPLKLITNSIIDGAGKGAWETWARRTQTMFNSPEEFTEDAQLFVSKSDEDEARKEAEKRVIPRSTGALSKCMEKLRPVLKNPEGYEVVLIGHSMGTIVMNEILHRYREFSFKHIVYMGAACSINDFRVNGIPYLRKHNDTKFYNLCLHPLAEQRESQAKGFVPRGSLLEWLDNFLTSPNTTLDRRMGKWENIVRTTSIIPNEVRSRITLKAFELCKDKNNSQYENKCKKCHRNSSQKPPNNPDNPQGHGEFTEQNFWEKAFWEP